MLIVTSEGIVELSRGFAEAAKMNSEIKAVMEDLGPKLANMMKRALAPHRDTGTLQDSVSWDYKSTSQELHIGSDMTRKNYNALTLLEEGVQNPIPNLPFAPIARWAERKGLPAGRIWMSIKESGVKAHPIREPMLLNPEFTSLLEEAAGQLGNKIILKAFAYNRGAY